MGYISNLCGQAQWGQLKLQREQKKQNDAIWGNMDAARDYHTKWSEVRKKRQIPYEITYRLNLK